MCSPLSGTFAFTPAVPRILVKTFTCAINVSTLVASRPATETQCGARGNSRGRCRRVVSRPWVLWRAPIAIGPSVGVVWAPFGMLIRAVRPTWGLGHPGAPTHNRVPGTETETQSPPCRAHRDPVLRTETQVRATETQAVVRDSATETQAWVVL